MMPFKRIIITVLAITAILNVSARQQTADIGLFAGGTYPFTDYSSSYFFQSLNPAVGVFYRYNFNTRYGLRINGKFANVGAVGYLDDTNNRISFNKNYGELGAMFEINYHDFMIGVKNMRFSPYVFYGIGMSFYPGADGQLVVTGNIPVGVGIKYGISKRVSVGAEFSTRKLFNDELDNLDDPYNELDLVKVNDLWHNNDWVNFFGLTLTYKFFRGSKPCPAF